MKSDDSYSVWDNTHNALPIGSDSPIWFLIGPIHWLDAKLMEEFLSRVQLEYSKHATLQICTIFVPISSPKSQEEAKFWSNNYWPSAYKQINPLGPQPSVVNRAEDEMRGHISYWMSLAHLVAQEASDRDVGEAVGCVVIERLHGNIENVMAAASDMRWYAKPSEMHGNQVSNTFGHAVMRAIGMIAKKRAVVESSTSSFHTRQPHQHSVLETSESAEICSIYCDSPVTDLEKYLYKLHQPASEGYLCTGLEVYVTHEPCVMCSMALLHSRISRCVFGKRRPMTGGLAADLAEPGVCISKNQSQTKFSNYGLFWRTELNWKFLCWQWGDSSLEEPEKQLVHI